jgi:3-methyladenine DNA glycosylase Tag
VNREALEGEDLEKLRKQPQFFVLEILDDKIVISVNESKLKAMIVQDIMASRMGKESDGLEALMKGLKLIDLIGRLPVQFGKVF